MNLSTELKSRLSAYLKEKSGLDSFRVWFATILRTANQYDEATQNLLWSVDSALARFGSGRTSQAELCAELRQIVDSPGKTATIPSSNIQLYCFHELSQVQFFPWDTSGTNVEVVSEQTSPHQSPPTLFLSHHAARSADG